MRRLLLRRGHPHVLPYVLFALLSLCVGNWFGPRQPSGFADTGLLSFFDDPSYLLRLLGYTWLPGPATGNRSPSSIAALPVAGFFALLQHFGAPAFLQQAAFYWLILFLSMSFMYGFLLRLFAERVDRAIIGIVGAVFYGFNVGTMLGYWFPGVLDLTLLPALPALLLLVDWTCERRHAQAYVLTSLLVSACSLTFVNPGFALPILGLTVAFWVYRTVYRVASIADALRAVGSGLLLLLSGALINAWLLLPLAASTQSVSQAVDALKPTVYLASASTNYSLASLFQLLSWKLHAPAWAYKSPAWESAYGSPPFVLIGFGIVAVGLVPLLRRRADSRVIFFVAVWLTGVFLCLGTSQPLAPAFLFLFDHVPLFHGFRSPLSKFLPLPVLAITGLFALGINDIRQAAQRRFGFFVAALGLLAVMVTVSVVYVFPMWTGSVVSAPIVIFGTTISTYVEVPPEYQAVTRYLDQSGQDFRVLALPLRPESFVDYRWRYGYDGTDLAWLLFHRSTLSNLAALDAGTARLLALAAHDGMPSLVKAAGRLGSRFIVVQRDVDLVHGSYDGTVLPSPEFLEGELIDLGIRRVFSSGALEVYAVPSEYVAPMVYLSDAAIASGDPSSDLARSMRSDTYQFRGQTLIPPSPSVPPGLLSTGQHVFASGTPRIVRAVEVSPVKWEVTVRAASAPFLLVALSSFDPGWKAFVAPAAHPGEDMASEGGALISAAAPPFAPRAAADARYLLAGPVSEQRHIMVDGFANGWSIDPGRYRGADITVTLYFLPQSYFLGGLIVAACSLLLFAVYLGLRPWLRATRKRAHGA